MSLIKTLLKPLLKSSLISLELAATATSVADAKKLFSKRTTSIIISNKEMVDVMKIVHSLEESGWLIKNVSEQLKMMQKKLKSGFPSMLPAKSGPS